MADIRQQVQVEVANEVGQLQVVTDALVRAGLNIEALCAWTEGATGHVLLVTENNEKACQAVTPVVERCSFQEVVTTTVVNRPGALDEVARRLSEEGINITMIYATAAGPGESYVVLATDDNEKTADLLNKGKV